MDHKKDPWERKQGGRSEKIDRKTCYYIYLYTFGDFAGFVYFDAADAGIAVQRWKIERRSESSAL